MGEDVYVGIDVSKTELVVAVRPSGESFTRASDRPGLKQVVAALWTAGVAVAAVNPSWVRGYARGSGLLAKTDRIDAKLLALFAQREQPAPRPPLDAETQALQELATRRDQLLEMRVAEQQRLQRAGAQVRKELRQHIVYLEGRIAQIDDDIDKTVGRSEPGGARVRCCAAFPEWARFSVPRCWPSCRNWARSAAKLLQLWSESPRSPMTAAGAAAVGSSGADAIRSAANFTCAR